MGLELLHLEWIDETHVVYKTRMYFKDGWDQSPHAIATLKDGQIIHIQPFSQSRYVELGRAALERNFRDYASNPVNHRTFERTVHDNYNIVFAGEPCDKAAWKKVVAGFSKRIAKAELTLFRWIDDDHVEYKIRQTFRDYSVRIPHAIGTIQDWKLIHSEPYHADWNNSSREKAAGATSNNDMGETGVVNAVGNHTNLSSGDNDGGTTEDLDFIPGAFRVPGLLENHRKEDNEIPEYASIGDPVNESALVEAEVAPDMADILEAARAEGRREVEDERQEGNAVVVATKSKTYRYAYTILALVSITIAVVVGVTIGRSGV